MGALDLELEIEEEEEEEEGGEEEEEEETTVLEWFEIQRLSDYREVWFASTFFRRVVGPDVGSVWNLESRKVPNQQKRNRKSASAQCVVDCWNLFL